tara:strand:- start:2376 stop:2819 length:444 start_codon:yes stop_codon:yes gene_type:complete
MPDLKYGLPVPLNRQVSEQMRRMPTKNSTPEIKLRRSLYAIGLRYRLHRKELPGKPDIALGPSKVVVFVDGCYWHNCPEHGTIPKNNSEWWKEKFQRNRERDRRNDELLREMGWLPIHVWEHEDPDEAAWKIGEIVKRRIDGTCQTS